MYDDLGSLAEKLKMSGVSFLEMNDEDGTTMQAVTTTPASPETSEEAQASAQQQDPAANRNEASHVSMPTNTLAWAKSRPTPVPAPGAFNSPVNGILDSVAALTRTVESETRERNPVRLEQLFSVIGK